MKITYEQTREEGDWLYGDTYVNGEKTSTWMQLKPGYRGKPPTWEELLEIEAKRIANWKRKQTERNHADQDHQANGQG